MTKPHNRRSIRLQGYNYTQSGAYFVTICTYQRFHLFGEVKDGDMFVNRWGEVVQQEWNQTGILRQNVELDAFVVMPNHVHCIIVIVDQDTNEDKRDTDGRVMVHHDPTTADDDAPTIKREFSKPIAHSLSTIVGAFKGAVTRQINRLPDPPDHPLWQRNYHEHIICSESDLNRIREYVQYNPVRWEVDTYYDS